MRVIVLDRIEERHPDISKTAAAEAWLSVVAWMPDMEKKIQGVILESVSIPKAGKLRLLPFGKTLIPGWLFMRKRQPKQTLSASLD